MSPGVQSTHSCLDRIERQPISNSSRFTKCTQKIDGDPRRRVNALTDCESQ